MNSFQQSGHDAMNSVRVELDGVVRVVTLSVLKPMVSLEVDDEVAS